MTGRQNIPTTNLQKTLPAPLKIQVPYGSLTFHITPSPAKRTHYPNFVLIIPLL